MSWTGEQVLPLAPDHSTAKSGKDLSAARKWKTLGANDTCAWGSVQGSGKDPYQTSIDFTGPAFKCSCPSRKFPCKHGLGLFLILAQQPAALTEKQPPAWTTDWLAKRVEKAEKKTAPPPPLDPEAQAKAAAAAEKRLASRESRVTGGLTELTHWLHDMVRSGFATLPGKPASYWENPAARLVDAQASGLARRVRDLDGITTTGEQWPGRLLHEISLLHLAGEGWTRLASLPEPTQADLKTTIGFTTAQEDVFAQASVRDKWLVAASCLEQEDRLRIQRTWLFGTQTKRPALCLSFSAAPNQPLDITLLPNTTIEANLVFFPGNWPLRALVKERHGQSQSGEPVLPHATIAEASAMSAAAFAANPWTERIPFGLQSVTPQRRASGWVVRDDAGNLLPLKLPEDRAWQLFAVSGGNPVALAGEWDGETLRPLSVWAEGRFLRL